MKSKRAEEYLDRKSPVKTVGDSKFYYPISRLEAEKAVDLAEQDAEERHKEAIEEVKKRAVRAHIESCSRVVPSDCDVKLCTECKRTNYFLQKLNER